MFIHHVLIDAHTQNMFILWCYTCMVLEARQKRVEEGDEAGNTGNLSLKRQARDSGEMSHRHRVPILHTPPARQKPTAHGAVCMCVVRARSGGSER